MLGLITPLRFAALVVLSWTATFTGVPHQVSTASLAQRYVFATPLATFISIADSPTHDQRFNWESDGCSAPVVGSTGASFDFTRPCRRHDFAYRNFPAIDTGILWSEKMRKRVDDQFMRDMKATCAGRPGYVRIRCNAWAEVFYRAVRLYSTT